MPLSPEDTLLELQSCLKHTLFVEADQASPRPFAVTLQGGVQDFVQVCQRVDVPVVFYEWFPLTIAHFSAYTSSEVARPRLEPVDLSSFPPMKPFLKLLGQPLLLIFSFPHAGLSVQLAVEASWWSKFEEALSQAEQEEGERRKKVIRFVDPDA